MNLHDIKTIIFDWDGTLHESMAIYQEAFTKAYNELVSLGYTPHKIFTQDEISSFLGKNPLEMWHTLLPNLDHDIYNKAIMSISLSMKTSIESNKAKLYPDALNVLTYLKQKGYKLHYLSNSKIYYMEAMKKAFSLDKYFDSFHVSEMYDYIPKHMILEKIKHGFESPMIMIGDRDSDMIAGQYNHLLTIGCLYGYGQEEELANADVKIKQLSDLYTIL